MLNALMLNGNVLNVTILKVIMMCLMLNVIMLNAVMLDVIMLSIGTLSAIIQCILASIKLRLRSSFDHLCYRKLTILGKIKTNRAIQVLTNTNLTCKYYFLFRLFSKPIMKIHCFNNRCLCSIFFQKKKFLAFQAFSAFCSSPVCGLKRIL